MPDSQPPEPKQPQEQQPIDVEGIIKQSSASVPIDVLVKRGKTSVKMVSREKFSELINQAIRNVLRTHTGKVPVNEAQIEAESKQEFEELLSEYQQSLQTQQMLQSSKEEMTREMEELRAELNRQREIASKTIGEEEEKRQIVALKEFEYQVERIIGKVIEKKGQQLESGGADPKKWDLDGLEAQLKPLIHKLCQEVFAALGPTFQSRDRMLALMERRLEKLYAHVQTLENALRQLTRAKVYSNAQIAGILRSVGILPEDANYEKKKEMLKKIFEHNVQLRQDLKKAGKSWATYDDAPAEKKAEPPPAA